MTGRVKIGVVGAGVCGLSSALSILQSVSNCDVTVIAENFTPDTVSDVAGAIIEPHLVSDTPIELQRQWLIATRDWIGSLYSGERANFIGISQLPIYSYFSTYQESPYWKDWLPGFRRLCKQELELVANKDNNLKIIDGWCATTFCIDTAKYLQWLIERISELGCRLVRKRLASLTELSSYEIVVNCSGIEAYDLTPDPSVFPIRGQVMRVCAPWIFHSSTYASENALIYIIPRASSVVLGGTAEVGDWNRNIRSETSKEIFENCCKLMPSIKQAKIIEEAVGLRPGRNSVRLEKETRKIGSKNLHIVHNYGHGGCGITLHWGCALHVSKLVEQITIGINKASSKL